MALLSESLDMVKYHGDDLNIANKLRDYIELLYSDIFNPDAGVDYGLIDEVWNYIIETINNSNRYSEDVFIALSELHVLFSHPVSDDDGNVFSYYSIVNRDKAELDTIISVKYTHHMDNQTNQSVNEVISAVGGYYFMLGKLMRDPVFDYPTMIDISQCTIKVLAHGIFNHLLNLIDHIYNPELVDTVRCLIQRCDEEVENM